MTTIARPRPRAPHARLYARPPLEKRAPDGAPRLCAHARQRCAEMGVDESVVQRIVQNPDVVWTSSTEGRGPDEQWVAKADEHPDYAVVFFRGDDGVPVIITVVFATDQDYARDGATFIPKEQP